MSSSDKSLEKWILPLSNVSKSYVNEVGSKVGNLGELLCEGYPVPEGFVLKVGAFDRFLAWNNLGEHITPEKLLDAPIPPDMERELLNSYKQLGGSSLAVRSSGIAEDLSDASFAGQYETVLGVQGLGAMMDAIKRCWASAFSPRVAVYTSMSQRTSKNVALRKMAVLVQRLVQADSAGVAFTANPVTGEREEVVINAVKGLGERLVSGQASPDEWVVRGKEARCILNPESAIQADQVLELAELARRIEKHFGSPQDIEWAFDGKKLFVLQSRGITTKLSKEEDLAPIPVPVNVPEEGFWQRDEVFHPHPYFPMDRSTSFPLENAAFRSMCSDFGLLIETQEGREIGGWYYFRLVPLGGKDRSPPPSWLFPLLIRFVPQMRSRVKVCVNAVRSDKHGRHIDLWYSEWSKKAASDAEKLKKVQLSSLSDKDLDEHIANCLKFLEEGFDIHFKLVVPWILTVGEFVFTCRELLRWDDKKILEMLSGLSTRSVEPSSALADLAKLAGGKEEIRKLIPIAGPISQELLKSVVSINNEFEEAFNRYADEYGCRTLRYVVSEPTLSEKPELILELVRDQITHGYNPESNASHLEKKRVALLAEARAQLTGASLEKFERVLHRAERGYPTLEDSQFYTAGVPRALSRYAILEMGDRLTRKAVIERRNDVFFLELDEARTGLRGERKDMQALVKRRKAERMWVEAHPGPRSYGKPPGTPPLFDAFPQEVRFAMSTLMWGIENVFPNQEVKKTEENSNMLKGVAASPGKYKGRVCIIMEEAQFHKLEAGDVLVCPVTTPVWSVLFPSIGALVTDKGGILSHPAIIAREYRIPAVVSTGSGTRLLHDGQMVTVDGDTGEVILDGERF